MNQPTIAKKIAAIQDYDARLQACETAALCCRKIWASEDDGFSVIVYTFEDGSNLSLRPASVVLVGGPVAPSA